MQFLKTLFWVALAVIVVLFASVNWTPVTIKLWGGLEADVKLPALVLFSFLLGFVPMLILHNARMWTLKRRLDAHERQAAAMAHLAPAAPVAPLPPPPTNEDRIDTDQKVWPA
jgi:lipopolysaccharide assembly protein A